ncbi:MAG TPA: hypothetical protein VHM90_15445 [Phycisphaerae bacterium]|nr:hypothetical protein [Phycisphaerae bacterium]
MPEILNYKPKMTEADLERSRRRVYHTVKKKAIVWGKMILVILGLILIIVIVALTIQTLQEKHHQ